MAADPPFPAALLLRLTWPMAVRLYASLNAEYLLDHVADSVIGGEFETPLVALVEALEARRSGAVEGVHRRGQPTGPFLKRLPFPVPVRSGLPAPWLS